MTKYTPIESEFADSDEEAAYDAWFRAKVQLSIDDPGPMIPHEQVMAKMRAIIANHESDARPLD